MLQSDRSRTGLMVELIIAEVSMSALHGLPYMEPAICVDESWHCMAGVGDFFVATVLLWVALLAIGAFFISLMRVTRRAKPWSRAFLFAAAISAVVLPVGWVGSSPARMKPWPAP